MTNEPVSTINSIITKQYLEKQTEDQYFERKGLGEKDIKPSKIAEELIGMLNADGGVFDALDYCLHSCYRCFDRAGERSRRTKVSFYS